MINGDMFRPLILNGESSSIGNCMGTIAVNECNENKSNKIQVVLSNAEKNFSEGYTGYLFEDAILSENIKNYLYKSAIPFLKCVNNIRTLADHDIVEIISNNKIARVLFRKDSGDNALVVTNNCNCNCIMCPEPFSVRQSGSIQVERIIDIINLIDSNPKYLCITGGEPTLLKEKLFIILDACRDKLSDTNFMILTNARMFSYMKYAYEFNLHRPRHTVLGVPIYGDSSEIHDAITNTKGSFQQTVTGVKNLLEMNVNIELRIVVSKLNYKNLIELSKFIVANFHKVLRVNIMALEMLGNAIVNKENVWIGFEEIKDIIKQTAVNLIRNGIEVYLYNFPLCFVDESLWSIALKSISDYKVRYFNECKVCVAKDKCGGFFNSTINLKGLKVKPIL